MTDRRVPVTVLTGFLGAGKTTLLNRILTEQHGLRIAVIENEFGEIGIDQALVVNADEEIFEMNNGCICCTVRGDLIRILGGLMRRRDRFDRILVETTGLADPGPVAQTFFVDDEIRGQLRLDAIVTVVDALHIDQHLDSSREVREQLAFADVILLNKVDLVSPGVLDGLERRIRAMNSLARIERGGHDGVDLSRLLDVGGFDLERALEVRPEFLEPEYPFEWCGQFRLEAGEYFLSLAPGPDPAMGVLWLSAAGDDPLTGADQALARFTAPAAACRPGERLTPDRQRQDLTVAGFGFSVFPLTIAQTGDYLLYTQHRPEEYNLILEGSGGRCLPQHEQAFAAAHTHDDQVTSVAIRRPGSLDPVAFQDWLGRLLREQGVDIYRMKGLVSLQGESCRFVFQGVHMLFDGKPDRPWGDSPRVNELVFIGRDLDRAALEAGFVACLV